MDDLNSFMFTNLERYVPRIAKDPPTQLTDLNNELRIYSDDSIDIWYSPMGEKVDNPKLWILGITPGWNQMRIAYEDAAEAMVEGMSPAQADRIAKPRVAFAGSMRKNLVSMLDELGLNELFSVNTCFDLFGTEQLRTGSVLKYPVFKNGTNYTGYSPKPTKHPALLNMIDSIFADELKLVDPCLIIPLGKMVEDVLQYSVDQGRLDSARVLKGFPHPSGANGHRKKQFNDNKAQLKNTVSQWYLNNGI